VGLEKLTVTSPAKVPSESYFYGVTTCLASAEANIKVTNTPANYNRLTTSLKIAQHNATSQSGLYYRDKL